MEVSYDTWRIVLPELIGSSVQPPFVERDHVDKTSTLKDRSAVCGACYRDYDYNLDPCHTMDTLTIFCWVRGEDVKTVFRVKISREADVEDLKDTLKLKKSTALRDVDADTLELYPLFIPSGADYLDELGKWRLHGKRPLSITQKLSP